ncbi:ACR3 family arsenite efflux transporter [Halobacteriovorax sp. JY17]|uniref:ACR3 family arsenite efflux transporter n=1 Tax=Halobacteriovorax sp. JY17 TaxID=2014617 RepID=UPI000C59A902|nr:ACR3 family arsenite efflux transporter [Halobacteriovorax sp. JY17]PIK16386.1 MAG: arsenical-resistance protein [Halobacteriovorax sp. JY17]
MDNQIENKKSINFFEKHLTTWVILCIVLGILIGRNFQGAVESLSLMSIASVNIPIAILIWFMIFPMMVQIDFTSVKNVGKNPKGLLLTLFINWLVKPFTMAFFAWIFFEKLYMGLISPAMAKEYIAGAILLGAAPCTAMVFVWSYLTDGDPEYTLVQVSINDLVLLVAFIPIVKLLLGVTNIAIPFDTLSASVIIFIVVPLFFGVIVNKVLNKTFGKEWFNEVFLKKLRPLSITSLLTTLVLLFAFQGDKIISNPVDILLIAIPLAIQTYFIFFCAWFIGKRMNLPHCILSPGSMIGASNFFELAVAVAIVLFGINSGAALVTVVGVLIEVPIMLSLVKISNKWKY